MLKVLGLVAAAGAATALATSARASVLQARDLRGGERQALCIDVAGAKQANGTDLLLWSCHGGTNQSFSFNRGSGEIRSAMGSWCVDVSSSGAWAGNRVQL